MVRPFRWDPERKVLHLLDQRRLPAEEVWIERAEAHEVADAIRDMVVRGAPDTRQRLGSRTWPLHC